MTLQEFYQQDWVSKYEKIMKSKKGPVELKNTCLQYFLNPEKLQSYTERSSDLITKAFTTEIYNFVCVCFSKNIDTTLIVEGLQSILLKYEDVLRNKKILKNS